MILLNKLELVRSRKLELRKMRKINKTIGSPTASLKVGGVAVSAKRMARRAYPAEEIHLTDPEGNVIGSMRFWTGTVDINLDTRLKVNLENDRYFWPEVQNVYNNDAGIILRIEAKKKELMDKGLTEDQAEAQALGEVGSWLLDEFKHGIVNPAERFPFAER